MRENGHNSTTSTPLVRGRSVVQSHVAAPKKPVESGLSDCPEYPYLSIDDATEREHAPTERAESVRDVLEAFEDWCDRQVFTPAGAVAAHHVRAYLRMGESYPLSPAGREKLAEHVAAVSNGRL